MPTPTCSRRPGSLRAVATAAVILNSLILAVGAARANVAPTSPPIGSTVATPDLDPVASALYLKAKTADSRLSYRGRLNTTYWRTGRTISVIVRHMAPDSLRIDYVEPDTVRGRAVVVNAGNEWTYNPSLHTITHGTLSAHGFITSTGLTLLAHNYILQVLPQPDIIIQRKAIVLEVIRRSNRTIARKFWVDAVTGLILKREVLGEDGKLTVTVAYADITFHPQLTSAVFDLRTAATAKGAKTVEESSKPNHNITPVVQGPPLPGSVIPPDAAGYHLVSCGTRSINTLQTEELHYSDGLELLSLFEQRPVRHKRPTVYASSMDKAFVDGKPAHISRRSSLETIIWDCGPLRLTLVGEANHDRMLTFATTVDQFISKANPK